MAFRYNTLVILSLFLLLSLSLNASSKSGKTKKKKPSPPKLSDNIVNNPFLQNSKNVTTDSSNYQGNPFLTNPTDLPLLFPNGYGGNVNENRQDQNQNEKQTVVNAKPSKATEYHSVTIAIYIRNPFLQADSSTANITETIPTNNQHVTIILPEDKISIDDIPRTSTSSFDTKTKSERKCKEYGRQILGTAGILPLVGTNPEITNIINQNCTPPNRLVTGGVDASPGEFPHMVALGVSNNNGIFSFSCGGILIAPQWVLTAAHCTYGPKSPTYARIGIHNLRDNQQGFSIPISRMIRHPSYQPPAMYADIALIKLSTAVSFNKNVRPACLYQQYDYVPTQAWVTGWGVTEFGGDEQSDTLQKAFLDTIDNIACAIRHNQSAAIPYGISPSMICAGDPRGGWNKDTCQGDSGGPLQIVHPDNACLFQVIGVTSFGQGCAVIDTPGVYTRVSHYLDWVESIVWP